MATRIFKQLNEAVDYSSLSSPHPYFLERLAYVQLNIKGNFTSGPSMCADRRYVTDTNYSADKYEYCNIIQKLHCSMNHFMRPYKLVVFGHNETDITKSHLLTRVWLDHVNGRNKVLALIESIDMDYDRGYMNSLNYKTIWTPDLHAAFEAKKIKQTVIQTDEHYKGFYKCIMELQ